MGNFVSFFAVVRRFIVDLYRILFVITVIVLVCSRNALYKEKAHHIHYVNFFTHMPYTFFRDVGSKSRVVRLWECAGVTAL